MEKDVVNYIIISEKNYQEFKKKIHKKDDYFSLNEWKKMVEKIDVILT